MSNQITIQTSEKLRDHLRQEIGEGQIESSPNDYMAKISFPFGRLVVYTNSKGGYKTLLTEIKPSPGKENLEEILKTIALKGLNTVTQTSPNQRPNLEPNQNQTQENTVPLQGAALIAYTDGSAEKGQCGWGTLLLDKSNLQEVARNSGNLGPQPSQQIAGEAEAAIATIKQAIELQSSQVEIHHDYQGIGLWNPKERRQADSKHKDVKQWKAKDPDAIRLKNWTDYAESKGLDVQYVWTKAHVGTAGNEAADELALEGTRKLPTPRIESPPEFKPKFKKNPQIEMAI